MKVMTDKKNKSKEQSGRKATSNNQGVVKLHGGQDVLSRILDSPREAETHAQPENKNNKSPLAQSFEKRQEVQTMGPSHHQQLPAIHQAAMNQVMNPYGGFPSQAYGQPMMPPDTQKGFLPTIQQQRGKQQNASQHQGQRGPKDMGVMPMGPVQQNYPVYNPYAMPYYPPQAFMPPNMYPGYNPNMGGPMNGQQEWYGQGGAQYMQYPGYDQQQQQQQYGEQEHKQSNAHHTRDHIRDHTRGGLPPVKGAMPKEVPYSQRRDVNYKPYSLSDYQSINKEIKLGGLGPDKQSDEFMTKAQKIQKQKEYAQAVRNLHAGHIPAVPVEEKPEKKAREDGKKTKRDAVSGDYVLIRITPNDTCFCRH
eukprot:Colp12_sorted_trinity150504_noHs@33374